MLTFVALHWSQDGEGGGAMTKAHADDHGAAHVAFKLTLLEELEGADELSTRVFRAFLNALRLHRQLMIASMSELDSHPAQAICLRFLSANDGVTQRDLADALHLARPTVSRMLQAMEKAGAIERSTDEHDQRLTHVYLTTRGHELEGELRTVLARYIGETIGSLSEDDRRELERLLDAYGHTISAAIAARRDAPEGATKQASAEGDTVPAHHAAGGPA
jgi:MarR family transcriptional regulator, organic hydroperoxide resistance regulator